MRLAHLAEVDETAELLAWVAALDRGAPVDYRELAALLALEWRDARPRFVGVCGGQGAGKSTLAGLIESACAQAGLRVLVLGIDDFYRTKAARRDLAESVHPLFETRGPPGTHDLGLCREVMAKAMTETTFSVPRFDKGLDDRVAPREVTGPFDLVVLEGWCVGARAAASDHELLDPINALEEKEDGSGVWRRAVNAALAQEYVPLWEELDSFVFLEVPNFEAVRRWRLEQEESLPPSRRLNASAIDRFVSHYERITLRMLRDASALSGWRVLLAEDHSVKAIRRVLSVLDD